MTITLGAIISWGSHRVCPLIPREINLTPKVGGKPMQDIGKYIPIYERQSGGAWGMAGGIWNSDNPQFIRR